MKKFGRHSVFWFGIAVILNNFVIGILGIYLPGIPQDYILLITTGVFCTLAFCVGFIPDKSNRKNNNTDATPSKVAPQESRASQHAPHAEVFDPKNRNDTHFAGNIADRFRFFF